MNSFKHQNKKWTQKHNGPEVCTKEELVVGVFGKDLHLQVCIPFLETHVFSKVFKSKFKWCRKQPCKRNARKLILVSKAIASFLFVWLVGWTLIWYIWHLILLKNSFACEFWMVAIMIIKSAIYCLPSTQTALYKTCDYISFFTTSYKVLLSSFNIRENWGYRKF